ncbi:MAG: hydroxyacid dehydrogenase [Planctomycetota bacterium]|nr:hydroxyacid dehydrogenase [Planctomycetota bacterium]MDA1139984.1 hydroxyacid dehydrogenase [Planctomycetota bacterium]
MKKAAYLLPKINYDKIYGEAERQDLARLVAVSPIHLTSELVSENPELLSDIQVIISGWGCVTFDERILSGAPDLEVVLYGAGSIRSAVTDTFWDRGIRITSGYGVNAIAVAEYTLSQILFCLKDGWRFAQAMKKQRTKPAVWEIPGAYGSTVGIVSLGMVGRRVAELLRHFDLNVLAYDPYASESVAAELGVRLVSLEEIFKTSDVVTLHTPNLPETQKMITGELIRSMKSGSVLINSSRGAVVDEPAMIEVLKHRCADLFAVLDVTHPEPPVPNSPLYTLDNVVLTPHIAGVMSGEIHRMGRCMVEELERFLGGEKMKFEITRVMADKLA